MNIETAIYQILKNDPGVAAIVSGRIFAGEIPQRPTYPVIAYRPPAGENRQVIRVIEGGCALVQQKMHVFSAHHGDGTYVFSVVNDLDYRIHEALDEFQGNVYDPTTSPIERIWVEGIFSTNLSHEYGRDDLTGTRQFVSEFNVFYLDPVRVTVDETP